MPVKKQNFKTIHSIKLREEFVDAVDSGDKCFEVRKNDRDYKVGDLVEFNEVDRNGNPKPGPNKLDGIKFKITYVLSGWGIENGYVVFGIKKEDKK